MGMAKMPNVIMHISIMVQVRLKTFVRLVTEAIRFESIGSLPKV